MRLLHAHRCGSRSAAGQQPVSSRSAAGQQPASSRPAAGSLHGDVLPVLPSFADTERAAHYLLV